MIQTDSDTSKDRRAQLAALVGLVLQVAVFAMLLTVSIVYPSPAIRAEAIHLQFGIYIWLALTLLYAQRRRAGVERLETEELKRARTNSPDAGIFSLEDEALLVQRRRLNAMYRWFLPAVALLLALGHIVWAGWWHATAPAVRDAAWTACPRPQLALPFVVGAAFFCFLYSRYATGMAREVQWRWLRAAASYMAGNAFLGLATVVALALDIYAIPLAEPIVTYAIWMVLLVLGIEFFLNFLLDFYRPRIPGAEQRPAFDSRLLGLISEPGGIARSIQEAINYQFGFEVSSTWFYQLLKRSLLPLALFGVVVLFGLSSLVIVDVDEQAFVEHFGRIQSANGVPVTLGPGLHFKYPWPVDAVHRARVAQLRRMTVGEAAKKAEPQDAEKKIPSVLWTEEHDYVPELMLLVASPQTSETSAGPTATTAPQSAPALHVSGRAVPVSMMMASVDLEYRVRDLQAYLYHYENPDKVMEDVAWRVLADHAASVDVTHFMGPARETISRELGALLQREYDRLGLGVELTFVGLQSAHPPWRENVAKTFQDVIAARSRKEAAIQTAVGEAERMLTKAAGSRERAVTLDQAIVEMNRLSTDPAADPAALAAAKTRVDELMLGNPAQNLAAMSGEAAANIAEARGEISRLVSEAESKARTFQNELIAYQAAPQLYEMRRYLDVLRDSLTKVRKVINTTQNTELVVVIEMEKASEFELPKPDKQ